MGYKDIYNQVLESLKKDEYPLDNQVWAAKRVTDALWQINLLFNSPQSGSVKNTLDAVKDIVNNRLEEPVKFD